jgi:N-acyl-L-homoserine lactone synthetase
MDASIATNTHLATVAGAKSLLYHSEGVTKATPRERILCRQLVKREYTKMGYSSNSGRDPHNKQTTVFCMTKENKIRGTISVITDSPTFGLPLDIVWAEDMADIRTQSKKIAEVGKFVVDSTQLPNSQCGLRPLARHFFSSVLEHSLSSEIDSLVVTVNPIHVRFYIFLGFSQKSREVKHLPTVNAPSVLLFVDVKEWMKRRLQPLIST